jgi:CheY-like chemotaxis protein
MIGASSMSGAGSAERPRVLLADDHPAMLALTADALGGECTVVGRVGDGSQLLAEAERLRPDVIVLDITMPRLDGIEAARRLQRWQRTARLVFLTVHEDADYARAALDAGGLGYVVKARLASDLLLPSVKCSPVVPSSRRPCTLVKRDRLLSISQGNQHQQKTMKETPTPFRILSSVKLPTISNRAPAIRLLLGIVGIGSVLLFSSGTMAIPNAAASNPDERSGGQVNRKAPPEMAWIPGGVLMGTNDRKVFNDGLPSVQVEVFGWMSNVTNAEFAKFVEATGYDHSGA